MNEKGVSEEELLEELSFFSGADTNFKKVFSSMCTIPHPIAVAAQQQFSLSNIGDPGLFQGTCQMENKIIEMAAFMLNHPDPKSASGHLTSGGTESNIEAVFHMKNRFLSSKNQSSNQPSSQSSIEISQNFQENERKLNLILPETAHFSFEKIANLLDVELKKSKVDSDFRVIPEFMASLIDENTIGLIGIAGNTEFGQCDPIEDLSKIALDHNLPLHIDAAFGGFVYPFLEKEIKFAFDFSGVTSVSLDPHKMGLSVIPSGILIFRNESFLNLSLDKVKVQTPYLTSKYQSTLTGTRSGSSVAGTYAVMKHLGQTGYKKNVAYCMDLVSHFQKKLLEIGLRPRILPEINIIVVSLEKTKPNGIIEIVNYFEIEKIRSQLLKEYGWNVSATKTIPALRFVLMPHVTKEDITLLISDLKKIICSENEEN